MQGNSNNQSWHKFAVGSYVIWQNIVYKVQSVISNGNDSNLYSIWRVYPTNDFPVSNVREEQLKPWNGTVGIINFDK